MRLLDWLTRKLIPSNWKLEPGINWLFYENGHPSQILAPSSAASVFWNFSPEKSFVFHQKHRSKLENPWYNSNLEAARLFYFSWFPSACDMEKWPITGISGPWKSANFATAIFLFFPFHWPLRLCGPQPATSPAFRSHGPGKAPDGDHYIAQATLPRQIGQWSLVSSH